MALRILVFILLLAFLVVAPHVSDAQSGRVNPSPTPQESPTPREDQDPIKVFTEEVRLPVVAFDDYGHFDPSLEMDDVLVLEDGTQQTIRSIRHIPASILLVLDVDNQITLAKDTHKTRAVALKLISRLKKDDEIAVLQFGSGVRVLHEWTSSIESVSEVLKTKMFAGKRGRISEALVAASRMLKDQPAGSRHVVLITDGIETPGGKVSYADAVKQLVAAQATVHVISYTQLVRDAIEARGKRKILSKGDGVQRESKVGTPDPTMPAPEINRSPSFRVMTIDTDRAMRRWYKKYSDATKANEQRLKTLAEETGGQLLMPVTDEELLAQADTVSRDIGAQYVITYRPTRPLASAKAGEYRKIEVAPRRTGVKLRTRRGYIAR